MGIKSQISSQPPIKVEVTDWINFVCKFKNKYLSMTNLFVFTMDFFGNMFFIILLHFLLRISQTEISNFKFKLKKVSDTQMVTNQD